MPSFEGSLSDEDIHDIILYLHTLKTPAPAPGTADGVSKLAGESFRRWIGKNRLLP